MLHLHYVGHFDIENPILPASGDQLLPQINVLRPIKKCVVDKVLESHIEISQFVEFDDRGYAVCQWSLAPPQKWDLVHDYAIALALHENAIVMNEPPGCLVVFPESAVDAQKRFWRNQTIHDAENAG